MVCPNKLLFKVMKLGHKIGIRTITAFKVKVVTETKANGSLPRLLAATVKFKVNHLLMSE